MSTASPYSSPALPASAPVPDVTVSVISKDEPSLATTLAILEGQVSQCAAEGVTVEVLVVDASDGRMDGIARAFPWVRWEAFTPRLDQPTSIPSQRNASVRSARAPIVAFCDCGGEPSSGWLLALTAPLRAGLLSFVTGPIVPIGDSVYGVMNDVPEGGVVPSPPTANVAFTREAFEAAGGFDERFAYGSDVNFAWCLANAGIDCISVPAAVMGMPWGSGKRQRKRAWQYGRARGRLAWLHPDKRVPLVLSEPELVAYPLWLVGAPVALGVSVARKSVWPAALAAAVLAVPLWRARGNDHPVSVVTNKMVHGAGLLAEVAARHPDTRRKVAPVLFSPQDPGPYQHAIIEQTEQLAPGAVAFFPKPTGSKTVNTALLPLSVLNMRAHGMRIWHLHWMHDFILPYGSSPLIRRAMRHWAHLTLALAHASGTKVIWTAHNTLPHEQIFDDEVRARRDLVAFADLVIAHDSVAAARVEELFAAEDVVIVPQGMRELSLPDRASSRSSFGIDDAERVLLVAGIVRQYKGVDVILEALRLHLLAHPDSRLSVLIVGDVDPGLRQQLDAALAALPTSRVHALLERVSDERMVQALAASDASVFAFRSILNSGSVAMALSAGHPVIVPHLDVFADLASEAPQAVRTFGASQPVSSIPDEDLLAGLLAVFADLDGLPTLPRVDPAPLLGTRSWKAVAGRTLSVYRQLLDSKSGLGRLSR